MLSTDLRLNALAKRRLEELDRAFEYLTDPKKFRDFHELVNDKLQAGNIEPGSLVASVAQSEVKAQLEAEKSTPSGPTGPSGPGSTEQRQPDANEVVHLSLAEEREVLKELRRKRQEKAPKIGQKRRQEMDKLVKDTLAEIEQAAATTARSKASELVARGVTDSDEFFERVYTEALEVAKVVRNRALKKVEDKNFPIDEKLIDEWELAVMDRSEEAAQREYNNLEGIMAEQRTRLPSDRSFRLKLLITLCLVAGVLAVFCNVNVFMTANRPDALQQQIKSAGGTDTTGSDISAVMSKLPRTIVAKPEFANAVGLAQAAGQAGPAGASNSLNIEGASAYNAGCASLSAGAYPDAIVSFTQAIERNKDIYQYFYNRSLAHVYSAEYSDALKDMDDAIALRTDLMQSRYNKGHIYLAGGADCIARAEKASGAEKEQLLRQGAINLRAAVAAFSVVDLKMPGLAQPVYNRALARYRIGDLAGAISDFELAVQRDPKMEAAAYNLAIAKAKQSAKPTSGGTIPGAPIGPQGPPGPGVF